jgi:hypothetical protein
MDITVTLDFTGHLRPDSFRAFAAHRAARLSLDCTVLRQDRRQATFRLRGPEVLVDAFEMAMSLGPADCLVLAVRREPGDEGMER